MKLTHTWDSLIVERESLTKKVGCPFIVRGGSRCLVVLAARSHEGQ